MKPPETVTATEIASFVYCAEQWRLEHGLGLRASNQPQRYSGTRHHAHKAIAERVAGGSIAFGRIMIIAALLALALLWASTR
jgi:hypothetical protein